jgi:hypothetical protein
MAAVHTLCGFFFDRTLTSTVDVDDITRIIVTDGTLRSALGRHPIGTAFHRAVLFFSRASPDTVGVSLFTQSGSDVADIYHVHMTQLLTVVDSREHPSSDESLTSPPKRRRGRPSKAARETITDHPDQEDDEGKADEEPPKEGVHAASGRRTPLLESPQRFADVQVPVKRKRGRPSNAELEARRRKEASV